MTEIRAHYTIIYNVRIPGYHEGEFGSTEPMKALKDGGGLWTPEPKTKGHPFGCPFALERAMGVEPTYQPWEGRILPMNYARKYRMRPTRPLSDGLLTIA